MKFSHLCPFFSGLTPYSVHTNDMKKNIKCELDVNVQQFVLSKVSFYAVYSELKIPWNAVKQFKIFENLIFFTWLPSIK